MKFFMRFAFITMFAALAAAHDLSDAEIVQLPECDFNSPGIPGTHCSVHGIVIEWQLIDGIAAWKTSDGLYMSKQRCFSLGQNFTVGYRCLTVQGKVFERVAREGFGQAWKGPRGLIWSEELGEGTQFTAYAKCTALNASLPSKSDFQDGLANGFRQVLSNMRNKAYWTSTISSDDRDGNLELFFANLNMFSGSYGQNVWSFRCVSK